MTDLDLNAISDMYKLLIQRDTVLTFKHDYSPVRHNVDMYDLFIELNKALDLFVIEITISRDEVIIRDEYLCICIPREGKPYVTKIYPRLKDARKLYPEYIIQILDILRLRIPNVYYTFQISTF